MNTPPKNDKADDYANSDKKTGKIDFASLSLKDRRFFSELAKSLAEQAALQFARDGIFSTEGKTQKEIRLEVARILKERINNGGIKFNHQIDYTEYLLSEARRVKKENKLEMSALIYSTYFEHQINKIIGGVCASKHLSSKSTKQALREINISGKCTWLLEILGCPPIDARICKSIQGINEIRNAFVHYKWPEAPLDKPSDDVLKQIKAAETIVRYLRDFEEKQFYRNHGKRIRKAYKNDNFLIGKK